MDVSKIFTGIYGRKYSHANKVLPNTKETINSAGNRVLTRITSSWKVEIEQEKIPNGIKRIMKIFMINKKTPVIEEIKTFITEKGGSLFGGKKQVIKRNYKVSWGFKSSSTFTKNYNKYNVLEHKRLIEDKDINGEKAIHNEAIQERILNSKLNNTTLDMFKNPKKNKKALHEFNGKNNFAKFGIEKTRYEELSSMQ